MTLKQIREKTSAEDLIPAIKFLCDNMRSMTYGEFIAYRRTLSGKLESLGVSFNDMNTMAEEYQVFGYITKESNK